MPRGGYRKGAGRKPEYTEPVIKFLVGLPESTLEQLDSYAAQHHFSRPKAIAALLKHLEKQEQYSLLMEELKIMQAELQTSLSFHHNSDKSKPNIS